MKPEGSLLCSQQLATGPHKEPFNIILSSTTVCPK
jgi:hypothetical protein